MKVLKICVLLVFALLLQAQGFSLSFGYDCGFGNSNGGNTYNLTIGLNEKATLGLDRELDSPAPPVPPEICYANFVAPEGKPPFNLLWSDIRPLVKSAIWELHTIRNSGGGKIYYPVADLPTDYSIWINGANISLLNGVVLTAEVDTLIYVICVQGTYTMKCAIPIVEDISAKFEIEIIKDDKTLEKISDYEIKDKVVLFDSSLESGRYDYKIGDFIGSIFIP